MWAYFVRTETADWPLEHSLKRQKNTQSVSWLTMKFPFHIKQGSYSFEPFKFHDFPLLFPWPFPVFHDFGYSCHLRKFLKLSLFLFRVFTSLSATDNTLVSTICAISKNPLITSFCPYFGVCSATDNTLVSIMCAISKSPLITSFCPYFGVCTN